MMSTIKRFAIALILVLCLTSIALAQEVAVRFYFVQIEQIGNARGPEHFPWRFDANPETELVGVAWSMKDYGLINAAIVAANVTQAQADYLALQTDVVAIPQDLEANITNAEINFLTNYLEPRNIPTDWITPSFTRREVLRLLTAMFLYFQRVTAITGTNPFDTGVTLNTQIRNIPQSWRDALAQAATELGYDTSSVTGTWTIRRYLKLMADQWGTRPIFFGFTTL